MKQYELVRANGQLKIVNTKSSFGRPCCVFELATSDVKFARVILARLNSPTPERKGDAP
jgi:hypothetical protein